MAPIRALHIGDLHIGVESYGQLDPETGVNGRILDVLHRFDDAISYALEREVDVVLFTGDAFKTNVPNPTYQREFARRIKRLADGGLPTILLAGNHDLPLAERRASSVEIFDTLDVPNVIVADVNRLHRIVTRRGDPLLVATVPYPLRNRLLDPDEARGLTIQQLDQKLEDAIGLVLSGLVNEAKETPELPAVLMGHFSMQGAVWGSELSIMLGRDAVIARSIVADPTWDYVALGHIHKHQNLNENNDPPLVYCGSIERIDFGEEKEEKGWVVAEIEKGKTTWQFVTHYEHPARPFRTLQVDVRGPSDPTDAILQAIEGQDLTGAVVRLILRLRSEQEPLLQERQLRAALQDAYYVAAIEKQVERLERTRLGNANVESLTPLQLLELYFEAKGVKQDRMARLLQAAKALMQEDPEDL